jgi:hypothetical protein
MFMQRHSVTARWAKSRHTPRLSLNVSKAVLATLACS